MKDLILFFGAGISRASGFPTVWDIDKFLFHTKYRFQNKTFIQSECNDDTVEEIQIFLHTLRNLDQFHLKESAPFYKNNKDGEIQFTGSVYRSDCNYEILYFLCEQIYKYKQGLLDSLSTSLMVRYLAQLEMGPKLFSIEQAMIYVCKIATKAMEYIESIVTSNLSMKAEEIKGLNLILDISKSQNFESISIITLNHDTLIEELFDANGIAYDDGFKDEGPVRIFYGFDSNSKIKIIKPHGGINWYVGRNENRNINFIPKVEVKNQYELKNGKKLNKLSTNPDILTGAGKIESYNYTTFAEMINEVHFCMKKCHTMIMCGYGWGDAAMNGRIDNWLANNDNKLLLLHPNPDELKASSIFLDSQWDYIVPVGKLVLIKKWLMEADMGDLGLI